MGQLIVRNLDEEIVRRLKVRAAEKGHSAEEEHREILRLVLLGDEAEGFKRWLLSMPNVGDDSDFERADDVGREVDL